MPVDNIYSSPVLLGDIWKHEYENLMVVSPDVGGVARAREAELDPARVESRIEARGLATRQQRGHDQGGYRAY